jgi:tetratricopeptide (TPR) repeat protein
MTRWLAAIVIVVLGTVGHADPESAPRRPMSVSARVYFDSGRQAYDTGAYDQAITAFQLGQRLEAHPDFLYALAQAYRKQGDCRRAIALYEAVLATRPPETEVARVGLNLVRCPSEPAARSSRPWYTDVIGGVLTGVGLVGLGAGTGYLVAAEHDVVAANRARTLTDHDRLAADGSHQRRLGTWFIAGGGVLTLAAIARYVLHDPSERDANNAIGLVPRVGGGVVSWEGRF